MREQLPASALFPAHRAAHFLDNIFQESDRFLTVIVQGQGFSDLRAGRQMHIAIALIKRSARVTELFCDLPVGGAENFVDECSLQHNHAACSTRFERDCKFDPLRAEIRAAKRLRSDLMHFATGGAKILLEMQALADFSAIQLAPRHGIVEGDFHGLG